MVVVSRLLFLSLAEEVVGVLRLVDERDCQFCFLSLLDVVDISLWLVLALHLGDGIAIPLF